MNRAVEELPEGAGEDIELASVAPGFSKELRRLLILLAVAAAAFAILYFTPLGQIARDIRHLRAFLAGDDLWAEASYAAIVTASVALGAPRLMFYVVGGLAFGFWSGLLLAQIGSLIGSYLTFCAVRGGGRGWLQARFGNHRLLGRAFRVRSSVKAVALIRQLPLSSVMINGALALSRVSSKDFLIGTFIGYLPQGVIATLIGSGLVDERAMEGFAKLLTAAVLVAGAFLLWRWRSKAGQRKRQS
jgi:uncharacterized membrane protein YdjX (TVP38/TMEM64 family)